jgi:molybdopterin synthase catalytic subunit/molybdopterin converting factor small subunit
MTTLTVRYHGGARELRGLASERVEVPDARTVDDVRAHIEAITPSLARVLPRCRFARNDDFTTLDAVIAEGDEIDVLPPVAGGSDGPVRLAAIRATPLSLDECHAAVAHPGAGGIVMFTGIVRDHANGIEVARLEYEAHGTLAEKELYRVLESVADDCPGVRLATTHRVGSLEVGELAIVIAASAAHRGDAFIAARLAIDRLKETVPIWKKEWSTDGASHWVNFGSG